MPATEMEGAETHKTFQGYNVEMRVHPCDALGQGDHLPFEYKAYLYSSTEVVVEVPVLDFTQQGKDDDHVRDYLTQEDGSYHGKSDQVLMEAVDNARNNLDDRMDNQDFPPTKSYRLIFDSSVHLSAEVLKTNEAFKDSSRLHLAPLPIEYPLTALEDDIFDFDDDMKWSDLQKKKIRLLDDNGMGVEQEVYAVPQPHMVVQRFVIELADLNKDAFKKGKVIKAVNVKGATAMMNAMGRKKKKKKGSS